MRTVILLLLTLAAGACDFTPVLDIELPAHERALWLSGVVAVDSTIAVRAGISSDPYVYEEEFITDPEPVTVLLQRDGVPDEILSNRNCTYTDFEGNEVRRICPTQFTSRTRLSAGETVRFIARFDGLPDAVATVTMPARVEVDRVATTEPADEFERVGVEFSLRDAAEREDFYGISIVKDITQPDFDCPSRECPDVTVSRPLDFTTSDIVLLSSGRVIPEVGIEFAAITDALFAGDTHRFSLDYQRYRFGDDETPPRLQVTAFGPDLFEAFAITVFSLSGSGENPFAEIAELPSNVDGGYGLVAGIAVFEAELSE